MGLDLILDIILVKKYLIDKRKNDLLKRLSEADQHSI